MSKSDPKGKAGSMKCKFDHTPVTATAALSRGMAAGAVKYGVKNWYDADGHTINTYINALRRHISLFEAGEDYARDTNKVHHIEAVVSGAAVLMELIYLEKVEDDRIKMNSDQLKKYANLICGKEYSTLPLHEETKDV